MAIDIDWQQWNLTYCHKRFKSKVGCLHLAVCLAICHLYTAQHGHWSPGTLVLWDTSVEGCLDLAGLARLLSICLHNSFLLSLSLITLWLACASFLQLLNGISDCQASSCNLSLRTIQLCVFSSASANCAFSAAACATAAGGPCSPNPKKHPGNPSGRHLTHHLVSHLVKHLGPVWQALMLC